jgi:hypothetical protein
MTNIGVRKLFVDEKKIRAVFEVEATVPPQMVEFTFPLEAGYEDIKKALYQLFRVVEAEAKKGLN